LKSKNLKFSYTIGDFKTVKVSCRFTTESQAMQHPCMLFNQVIASHFIFQCTCPNEKQTALSVSSHSQFYRKDSRARQALLLRLVSIFQIIPYHKISFNGPFQTFECGTKQNATSHHIHLLLTISQGESNMNKFYVLFMLMNMKVLISALSADHLKDVYRLKEFHGHWGYTEEDGSGHQLNRHAFSGELHFTFWKQKYGTYKQCLAFSDGIAILAVFLSLNILRTVTGDNAREMQSVNDRRVRRDEHEGSSGEKQSPINITKQIIDYDPTLKSSQLKFSYTLGDATTVEIKEKGFSVKMKETATSSWHFHYIIAQPTDAFLALVGSHLPATYRFREFHGHWGGTEEDGSEHRLNGRAFSGELHFMFWDTEHKTYEEALKKSNGIAILAVFVLMDAEDNSKFTPLLSAIEESLAKEEPIPIPQNFDFSSLLPDKLHYYTYEGSITVPPFSECALWTILHRPIPIGMQQLEMLRTVVGDNARAMQDVNKRRVRCSFKTVAKH
uniref:Carbonic anhydrase n=1 Tax=Anisakis simplex TaxID=6269 RepID=A0A0M3JYU0_ANISI